MANFKYPDPYKLFNIITYIGLLVFYVIPTIYGMAFKHSNIGVVFSPYVHSRVHFENIKDDWVTYNLSDIKTMVKIISTRFPKVITYGIGSRHFDNDSDRYIWDSNYYQCYSQVYISEAVAMVNNATYYEYEENAGKSRDQDHEFQPLEVYQGIFIPAHRLLVDLELCVAIEAIQKANSLFPGTVTAIVFQSEIDAQNDYGNATLILDAIKKVELKAIQNGLKIGTKENCEGIYSGEGDIGEKRRKILHISNFIICQVIPSLEMNVTEAVVWVIGRIQKYTRELKTLNPWIDVMFETGWPSDHGNETETNELKTFWEYLESWSLKYDMSLWLNEAFDTPWSYLERQSHWGWWKLGNDYETSIENGYMEKVPHDGVKYTKKSRGNAMHNERLKIQKIEQLLPSVLAFGRLHNPKYVEAITEAHYKDEEIVVLDE